MTTKPSNPKDIVGTRKAPFSTTSAAVMAEVGVAMLEGAAKYGRHNYRAVGVRASVYYDATLRHLFSWFEGEDIDPDSGMHHVTKALASLMVLRDAMIQGKCTDDRPPSSQEFYARLNQKAAEIIDKHAGKNPRHYTIADNEKPMPVPALVPSAIQAELVKFRQSIPVPESALNEAGLGDEHDALTFGPIVCPKCQRNQLSEPCANPGGCAFRPFQDAWENVVAA
jgi:hypothetical protein